MPAFVYLQRMGKRERDNLRQHSQKHLIMLTQKEFQDKKGGKCPYGRNTNVGDTRCMNCKFHHIEKEYCSGEFDTVYAHMRRLKLDY